MIKIESGLTIMSNHTKDLDKIQVVGRTGASPVPNNVTHDYEYARAEG